MLLNISDHYTRIRLQNPSIIENGERNFFCPSFFLLLTTSCIGRVFGALLASQSGRNIDIVNSFELPFQLAEDGVNHLLDKTFLLYKLDQCMKTDNFSSSMTKEIILNSEASVSYT